MLSLLSITIICLSLLALWHKYKLSLDPKYLKERYTYALWYQERLQKYHELKKNADIAYSIAIENAKKDMRSNRFTAKRIKSEEIGGL